MRRERFVRVDGGDLAALREALSNGAGAEGEVLAAGTGAAAHLDGLFNIGTRNDLVERAYLTGKLHLLLEDNAEVLRRDAKTKSLAERFSAALPLRRPRNPPNGPVPVDRWLTRFRKFAAMTCAISVPGAHLGSGFLVGPDLVLTSFHVLKDVLRDGSLAPGVRMIFDQELQEDGVISSPTDEVELHEDFRVMDAESVSAPELDFVLVRTKTSPGYTRLSSGVRSWVSLPLEPVTITKDLNVMALHRPRPDALMYSAGVVCTTTSDAIVQYTLNMLSGSSGAPVFDLGWNLIAIHRSDVAPSRIGPSCTQGVLADRITARLRLADALPEKAPFGLPMD